MIIRCMFFLAVVFIPATLAAVSCSMLPGSGCNSTDAGTTVFTRIFNGAVEFYCDGGSSFGVWGDPFDNEELCILNISSTEEAIRNFPNFNETIVLPEFQRICCTATLAPTANPTLSPSVRPSPSPSASPSRPPSPAPSQTPTTSNPSVSPTPSPTDTPSYSPTTPEPTVPTASPTDFFENETNIFIVAGSGGALLLLIAGACFFYARRGKRRAKPLSPRSSRPDGEKPRATPSVKKKINNMVENNIFDWEKHIDKRSGEVYFFNPKTGESRWDPPDFVTDTVQKISAELTKSLDP